jgi:hypothetical protein
MIARFWVLVTGYLAVQTTKPREGCEALFDFIKSQTQDQHCFQMSIKKQAPTDYAARTVVELRKELRKRGLSTAGRKADLVQRLTGTAAPATLSPATGITRTPPRSIGESLFAILWLALAKCCLCRGPVV